MFVSNPNEAVYNFSNLFFWVVYTDDTTEKVNAVSTWAVAEVAGTANTTGKEFTFIPEESKYIKYGVICGGTAGTVANTEPNGNPGDVNYRMYPSELGKPFLIDYYFDDTAGGSATFVARYDRSYQAPYKIIVAFKELLTGNISYRTGLPYSSEKVHSFFVNIDSEYVGSCMGITAVAVSDDNFTEEDLLTTNFNNYSNIINVFHNPAKYSRIPKVVYSKFTQNSFKCAITKASSIKLEVGSGNNTGVCVSVIIKNSSGVLSNSLLTGTPTGYWYVFEYTAPTGYTVEKAIVMKWNNVPPTVSTYDEDSSNTPFITQFLYP